MTFQEILDGITRHRANPVGMFTNIPSGVTTINTDDLARKLNEIEWALQAIAETCRDKDFGEGMIAALKKGIDNVQK